MAEKTTDQDKKEGGSNPMSFWDHLEELRSRLIKTILFVIAGFCAVYAFVPGMQEFLIERFFEEEVAPLAFLAPTEGFIVRLKLGFIGGLIIASPGVFYQFWRFVAPGLYAKEKHFVIPVVITSTVSFLVGAAFSFFVLPYATRFFLSFAGTEIQNAWSFGSYVDFIIRILLAFGLVFELPLVIYFLVRLGIVTPQFLRKKRRYAIIIFLVLAAVISPPDIFTMVVLAVPLTVLYELSIIIASFTHRKHHAPGDKKSASS
ncbi:twin-arginine translocase subunit TatC [candidate division LCP-89 bacterium B3_LCP]|uniref:Sec-independent protein translocase protein TatC n=1 Tax=candidate division LCP-89 bacterium B3_LCP TaxID=2012998 RepID=A0A532UZ99_UNCL8|nr:MAG: twin-arginine translocase subunit TatC [candidate division LCP-89 bacterium B3_LCP]